MAQVFKNFEAANRKPNLIPFYLLPANYDTSWISANFPVPGATQSIFSATLAFEATDGLIQSIVLTGNVTSSTLKYNGSTTIPYGAQVILRIVQDATGNRTFALPANLSVDISYVIDPTANWATILNLQGGPGGKWEFAAPPNSFPTA